MQHWQHESERALIRTKATSFLIEGGFLEQWLIFEIRDVTTYEEMAWMDGIESHVIREAKVNQLEQLHEEVLEGFSAHILEFDR